MKHFVFSLLPKSLRFLVNHIYYNRIIKNHFNTNHKKRALLSYILLPFYKDSLSHTNFFEARSWAKALNELEYIVDVVDYRNQSQIDVSKYDLICGFGDVFQRVFESQTTSNIKTITYGTGMHFFYQNQVSTKRVKDVFDKKGIWLGKSARLVEKTWTHNTTLVDGIISLGNEVIANTYRKYYNGLVLSLPAPYYKTLNPESLIRERQINSLKHYLWFGSSGLIHKGLDLCLDYFVNNEDLFLHICGPIENDFMKAYHFELFESPNIKFHGFIDIKSKKFENLLKTCSFCIFPSCSEGGSPGLVTVIGNGGLIPIMTRESGVEIGFQIWIDGFNYKSIESAITTSKKLSFIEVQDLQYKNYIYVESNHSSEKYFQLLKSHITQILQIDEY